MERYVRLTILIFTFFVLTSTEVLADMPGFGPKGYYPTPQQKIQVLDIDLFLLPKYIIPGLVVPLVIVFSIVLLNKIRNR